MHFMHPPKLVQIGWGHHVHFCVWKKSAITFGEGCSQQVDFSSYLPEPEWTLPYKNHHWRCSASIDWGSTSCAFCDAGSICDTWWDAWTDSQLEACLQSLIASFMGPTWVPSGADRTQLGPMLIPWNLLSGICSELTTSPENGGSSLRANEEPRWNDCPWPFGSNVCLLELWSYSSDLQATADVADQCVGCVAKFCWRILATHPTFLPLLAENIPQPTILRHASVFALENYAAWCPQRIIVSAQLVSKKHTYYWIVNLLDRFHPKWQQLGWLTFNHQVEGRSWIYVQHVNLASFGVDP